MKKLLASIVLAILFTANVSAQEEWTINSRAWTTNYFTMLIWDAVTVSSKTLLFGENQADSIAADRIIPDADLVFPIGVQKKGFGGVTEIYCPYHRAFANPFTNPGDYAIGVDASWKPSLIGLYAGAYFKSQEVVFKQFNSIRGYYFQPRLGVVIGKSSEHTLELGTFYDLLTGSGGRMAGPKKDKLRSGFGLDVAYSRSHNDGKYSYQLQVSIPFHNFFSKDVEKVDGFKRKVGYIMLTTRIAL